MQFVYLIIGAGVLALAGYAYTLLANLAKIAMYIIAIT